MKYKHLLPAGFSPDSKVWIYQADGLTGIGEVLQAEEMIKDFTANWKSHGAPVKGWGSIFFGRFLVLMADESDVQVGGCSTDSSVALVRQVSKATGRDFFNRTLLAFVIKDKIELLPMTQLSYAVENNFINSETLYFNNLVSTKMELENNWIVPAGQSWLAKKVQGLGLQQAINP